MLKSVPGSGERLHAFVSMSPKHDWFQTVFRSTYFCHRVQVEMSPTWTNLLRRKKHIRVIYSHVHTFNISMTGTGLLGQLPWTFSQEGLRQLCRVLQTDVQVVSKQVNSTNQPIGCAKIFFGTQYTNCFLFFWELSHSMLFRWWW